MTIDCPLPHPSALLDNNGYMGSAWWACIKAVHERTGGAQGVSSKDMEAAIGNEAATRAAADTALQAALNAEATARANGDSAEAAARQAADTFILTYAQQTNALLHETITRGAAPLDSPHFVGTPTAPTPLTGDNDSSIATTAFVQTAIGSGTGFLPLSGGTLTGPLAGPHIRAVIFEVDISSGPTWTAGVGAPTSGDPAGSIYSRMDAAVGATLYISQGGGVWNAIPGV
jgi:hypothetical protein